MKKFWIVLLALGLVAGFAMSASAADVKFSGSYYVYGIYVDNPEFKKDGKQAQAYFHQRLRVQTEFKIAEGLSLVTRFDALEKPWAYGGAANGWRQKSGGFNVGYDVTNRPSTGDSGARTQENIEWERAYIDFTTKIGRFNVGYQNFIAWGTMFLDTHGTRPGIKWFIPIGDLTIVAALEKTAESSLQDTATTARYTNGDNNIYDLGAIYKFSGGDAGLLFQYGDLQATAQLPLPNRKGSQMYILMPYAKFKTGGFFFEAEAVYGWGKWSDGSYADADGSALGVYLHGRGDFGPAYVGGIFAWMQGDDPKTTDKKEGTFAAQLVAGQAWDPMLILWNDGLYAGSHRQIGTGLGVFFDNAFLVQVYGGFKPVKEADIMLSVSWAKADKKPMVGGKEYVSDEIGYEIDLVAKYKVFDNLEYMIGAAYLWCGRLLQGHQFGQPDRQ